MEREKTRRGQWPISRVTIGSGLPRSAPILALELCPGQLLSPGQTGHPSSTALLRSESHQRDEVGMLLEAGGRVRPRESSLHLSGIFLTRCLLLSPGPALPCPGVGPEQRASRGGRLCPAGEWGAAGAKQAGLCVAATCSFLRMIEHLHPSVVNGPSSFPASLASAYPSPAVLDQRIHHTDWCSPHQFSCSPCYPNLS